MAQIALSATLPKPHLTKHQQNHISNTNKLNNPNKIPTNNKHMHIHLQFKTSNHNQPNAYHKHQTNTCTNNKQPNNHSVQHPATHSTNSTSPNNNTQHHSYPHQAQVKFQNNLTNANEHDHLPPTRATEDVVAPTHSTKHQTDPDTIRTDPTAPAPPPIITPQKLQTK
jgi:hypothetical protein